LFDRASIVDRLLPLKNVAIDELSRLQESDRWCALRPYRQYDRACCVQRSGWSIRYRRASRLESFQTELEIQNLGDTLWIAGRETRLGIVMPGVKLLDEAGKLLAGSSW
jgi:hypothetical protein